MASPNTANLLANRFGHLPWRKQVIRLTSASTRVDLTFKDSGAVIFCPEMSSLHIRLPKISTLSLGITYDLFIENVTTVAESFILQSNIDSSALICIPGLTSITDEDSTIVPISSGRKQIRLTAVSSILWMGEPVGQVGDLTSDAIQDEDFENGSWTTI